MFEECASCEHIEKLVVPPYFSIHLHIDTIVPLHERVHKFVNINWFFFFDTTSKHVTFEHLIYCHMTCELEHISKFHLAEPIIIEFYFCTISSRKANKFFCLFFVQFQICFYFFFSKLLTRSSLVCRISNTCSKISYQKDYFMTKILKMSQLAKLNSVPEVECWSRRIKPCIDTKLFILYQ